MNPWVSRVVVVTALATLLPPTTRAVQQSAPGRPDKSELPKTREFSDADALIVLQRIADALESHNEQHFLHEFDPASMPDYAVFRDQVHTFFAEYESFRVSYHLQQVAVKGANGVALADFIIEGRSVEGEQPDMRQEVQLRLVLHWNGTAWKIADLSPRELFR